MPCDKTNEKKGKKKQTFYHLSLETEDKGPKFL